jgi:hypothetical protein
MSAHDDSSRPSHERRDAPPRLLAVLAIGVAAATLFWALILLGIYHDQVLHPRPVTVPAIPAPRLQIDEPRALARHRAAEAKRLNSYGWVDRARGIAHIPIDEAMRRVARQGIPGWPGARP